jgi:hypothetical protein
MLRAPVDPLVCLSNGVPHHRTHCAFQLFTRTHQLEHASYRRRTRACGPVTRFHASSYRVLATLLTRLVFNKTLEEEALTKVRTHRVRRARCVSRGDYIPGLRNADRS